MLLEAIHIANEFLPILKNILHTSDISVEIKEDEEETIPETGVGGYSPDSHTVLIYINPNHQDLRKNLETRIRSTLAHEFHHAVRNRSINWKTDNLLGAMITEGLADHFDREVNKEYCQPWSTALDKTLLDDMMEKSKIEWFHKAYNHHAWFFGSEEIPKWTGYSLGFKMVGDYLRKTGNKASELVSAPANLFI